jgi:hypothetical protein
MSESILLVLESDLIATAPARKRGRVVVDPAMLYHGRDFVLDGNRLRVSRETATWWLKTVDPNTRLRVMADDSVWVYRHIGNGRFARMHEIEDAWEMMTPLADAVADCDRHGHAWSPDQISSAAGRVSFVWAWCLVCGVERVVSRDHSRELIWPADASLIQIATGRRLPTLHGPLFG